MVTCDPAEVQTELHSNKRMITDKLTPFSCLDSPACVPHTSAVASHKFFSQLHWLLYHSQHPSPSSLSLDSFRVWFIYTFPSLTINILLSLPVIFFLPRLIMPLNSECSHISPATQLITSHYVPFFLYPDMPTCAQCRLFKKFLLYVSLYRVGIIHTLPLKVLSIHHFDPIRIDSIIK